MPTISATDFLTWLDSPGISLGVSYSPADSLTWSDSVFPLTTDENVSLSDSLSWSDSISLTLGLNPQPSDLFSWSDVPLFSNYPWDSTTPVNSVVSFSVIHLSTILLTLTPQGSISGGHVTFEEDNETGQWAPASVLSGSGPGSGVQQSGTSLVSLPATNSWSFNGERTGVRVRLDTAITGAGTVAVVTSAQPVPPAWLPGLAVSFGDRVATWQDTEQAVVGLQPNPVDSLVWSDSAAINLV